MAYFRKRPIVVEAVRFSGTNHDELWTFTGGVFLALDDYERPDIRGQVFDKLHDSWIGVKVGQWVVRGIHGEHYPIDAQVLSETYDRLGDVEMGESLVDNVVSDSAVVT